MIKFFAALLVVTVSLLGPGLAQDAPAPASGPATDVRRVLVIGDQLAGGMGAGLARMAEGDATIQVVNRFNESSGLARPEIYDWALAIPKMVEGKNITSAVVLMGLNDRRDMRLSDRVIKFGTPEWNAAYQRRVDDVIDALAVQRIQVLWMGEPPMGDPALDADMQNLTALMKERVMAKGAGFIDLRGPFLSPQGGYTDRGPDDTGADRRLRESDGVTFFKVGNNRLGQIALAAVKGTAMPPAAATPAPQAAIVPNAPVAVAPNAPTQPKPDNNGPIFGGEGMDNAAQAQGSKALSAAVEQDKAMKAAKDASSIGIGAAKGSNAEALFTKGLSAPPPAGRFDDFTIHN